MHAPWKKSYDQPTQHIKKQRHYFAVKGPSGSSYGFSSSHVWIWELAERQRVDTFELWCWRRLLRVPWTARRSNQSILKEISPEYSLEGLMLKLKLLHFGHLMWRTFPMGKDPDAGKAWRQEEKGTPEDEMVGWHHWLNGHGLGGLRELVIPSNHLILCCPLLYLPSIFPSNRDFSNESALCIRWPKYWSFSFNASPSIEHPGLIFRMDWLDLLAVQGTL